MANEKVILREFAYIDAQKVIDLLSSIENGLPKEIVHFEKALGSEFGGKLQLGVIEVDKTRERKETESRESKIPTDASIFNRLYESLEKNKLINHFSGDLNNIVIGDVYEVRGNCFPSSMDAIFEIMKPFLPFVITKQPTTKKTRTKKHSLKSKSREPSVQEIFQMIIERPTFSFRIETEDEAQIIGTGLKKYLRVQITELEGYYIVIGRVRQIIKEGEKYKLFTFKGGLKLPDEIIKQIVSTFPPEISTFFGREISEEDFQIKGPSVVLSPIAIYQ